MAAGCTRHHHHMHLRILDHLFAGPVALDARMAFLRIVTWSGGSLDDGVEMEVRHGCDQGDVEDFGGEAVADDGDVVGM